MLTRRDSVLWDRRRGEDESTDTAYYSSSSLPTTIGAGMFLQIIGPTTHPAYHEQRRILNVGTNKI